MQDGPRTFHFLMGLSFGTSLGVALGLFGLPRLGLSIGAALAIGVAVGAVLGLALGAAIASWKR